MAGVIAAVTTNPVVAHLIRAATRFGARLGTQFAAAMTYFSVLSVVPIAMFVFTILGFVLDLRPDLQAPVQDTISSSLGFAPGDATEQIQRVINGFIEDYRTVGVVAIFAALYSGSGWVGNLKRAVRAQWRPRFDDPEQQPNIVVETLINFALLIVLLLLVGLTLGMTVSATALNDQILGWLGLSEVAGIGVISRVITLVLTVAFAWVFFAFIYKVFPQYPVPRRAWLSGSLIAAIGLTGLQIGAGALVGVFSGNRAIAVFGPIIVVMLVLNLFATLILFIAAWIATADQPAVPDADTGPAVDIEAPMQGPAMPPRLQSGQRYAARVTARPLDGQVPWVPGQGQTWVTQDVAKKSLRAGIGAGWVTGIATGVGIGASIAGLAARIGRRRSGRRRTGS